MTYEEFEWQILRLVYEEQVTRLRPPMLAYVLGLPIETVNAYLETAVSSQVLELDISEEGLIEYFVPGAEEFAALPKPVWQSDEVAVESDGVDGSLTSDPKPRVSKNGNIPPSLQRHIQTRYGSPDGGARHEMVAINSPQRPGMDTQPHSLVPHETSNLPTRIESNDEAFTDPSRTMFMRQIRVYGSQNSRDISDQVTRLFQSFGYRMVETTENRVRFERGSVMFILALVPLFILVVPLFIYLFLYCMGRSTIHQEPVMLDVQYRRKGDSEPFWEIDLTFVGLHGVVLGAADQQVLNREIDTLRDELRWALGRGRMLTTEL